MKMCLKCFTLNEYISVICPHCESEKLLAIATNEKEYHLLISEYINDSGVFVLNDISFDSLDFGNNVVLLDNEKMVYFFKSEQDAEGFKKGKLTLKKRQNTIKFDGIKNVGLPEFYQESRYKQIDTYDIFSFVINTTEHQKIKFMCTSIKLDEDTCYRFFSQLIVRNRLFYRRMGEGVMIHNKWLYVFIIAIFPICISKGWSTDNYILFWFGLLLPIVTLKFYGFMHSRKSKIYFISQSAKAMSQKDIVDNKSKHENDIHLLQISIILAVAYLIYYFWLL